MKLNWTLETWTVEKFDAHNRFIDMMPIGQRLETSENPIGGSKPSKQQSIIASMLRGSDIGEIKIVKVKDSASIYLYESIDGGHRKRAIRDFLDNKFPTHKSSNVGEKYYTQLTEEEREDFNQYRIRFVIYEQLTSRQKGELFRDTNNTTPVNKQETLNSYGDLPIANLIRNNSRNVNDNTPHELFEWSQTNGGNISYRNIAFNNNRLVIDELVARITYMIYSGEVLTTTTFDQLQSMYDDPNLTQKEVNTIGKKLKGALDFLLKVSVYRKQTHGRGLSKGMVVMLSRLYFSFKETYGSFKIEDYKAFWLEFYKAFSAFDLRNPTRHDIVEKNKDGTGGRLIYEAFNQHLGEHNTLYKAQNTVKWMLEEMDLEKATVLPIEEAYFSRNDIEVMLARQGYKCWVSGVPLTMKDAQGGHIIPRSKGGTNDISNLVVITAEHNRRMQDMNAHDYKKMYLETLSEAA